MPKQNFGKEDNEDEESKTHEDEFEAINSARALWTRSRSEVEEEEYREFYKHVSHDFEDPLDWSHNKVEGKLEYTSLLYLPKRAPFDLYNRDAPKGLKLYVQRVFIMDEAEQFLPLYLRFVKGVIDSNDLPLNVSREILQQDEKVVSIRNALTKRALTMMESLGKKEPEKYQEFYDEFGEVLKEGAGEDFANRESISKLLRFASTKGEGDKKAVSLDQYVERKIDDQKDIYYICAETFSAASQSPHLEIFNKRGIEVLLLSDRIDEWSDPVGEAGALFPAKTPPDAAALPLCHSGVAAAALTPCYGGAAAPLRRSRESRERRRARPRQHRAAPTAARVGRSG